MIKEEIKEKPSIIPTRIIKKLPILIIKIL